MTLADSGDSRLAPHKRATPCGPPAGKSVCKGGEDTRMRKQKGVVDHKETKARPKPPSAGNYLEHNVPLSSASVSERMAWASQRNTNRGEVSSYISRYSGSIVSGALREVCARA
ncbi:hypothetical protein B0H67DRAFT_567382 [Lasiosphaeris hirsuta]|uniref:Uncharacterized protein n=1 Tax=Lasiosphaeris hirsuta TaxID=260670 RepID=A0AA40E3Y8_9PEZI|nr:hypothetical protein B0H67DRAFT_567382 [Lasiosphaeris hirsuta]